jgi:hypothetical protein
LNREEQLTQNQAKRVYADGTVIIARSREKITEIYKEMEERARKTELEVNERKI